MWYTNLQNKKDPVITSEKVSTGFLFAHVIKDDL